MSEHLKRKIPELKHGFQREVAAFATRDEYENPMPSFARRNGVVDPCFFTGLGVVVGFLFLIGGGAIAFALATIHPFLAIIGIAIGMFGFCGSPAVFGAMAQRGCFVGDARFDSFKKAQQRCERKRGALLFARETQQSAVAALVDQEQVLLVRCNACEFVNDEHHKFCAQCGTSLL